MGFPSALSASAAAGGVWIGAVLLLLSILLTIGLRLRSGTDPSATARTWLLAGVVVIVLQGVALAYPLLALGMDAQPVLLPAVRWSADTLSWIALLGAACLSTLPPRGRLALPISAAVVLLAGLGYAWGSGRAESTGCQPALWPAAACPPPAGLLLLALIAGLTISASACAWLIVRRPTGWRWFAMAAGSLGIAVFLDLALARTAWPPGPFALLATVLVFAQYLLADFGPEPTAAQPPAALPPSTSPAHSLRAAVDFAHLMQAGSVSELADAAVKATALATRVEFVLLLSPPDDRGRFSAAKGYDHIRERPLSGFAMHGRAYPAIQEALVERRVLEVTDDPKPPDLEGLMDEMEAYESGTLLLLPILSGEALRAGLLLFSPFAQHRWSIEEKAQLGRLCSLLAERFTQLDQRSPSADVAADGISRPAVVVGGAASPARAWSEPQPSAGQPSDEMLLVLQELAEARSQLALLAADQQAHASTLDQAAALRALSARLEQGLRSVSSYSSLLLDDIAGALTTVQRKYLERLHAGLARSQDLAQDLRDRLAPGSELLEDEGEWAELDACLQQVMARYTVALREHQLRLQLDLPERSPVLRAEPGVLEQVLDNLLANAVAVTPDGEDVTITAHVIRDAGSSYMLLDVADRGPGIATEHLGMVFEPQVSAEAHRPAGIQDGGAGLPLVKRLCEAVGGRVWVDSRPGYGTTYTALLPLAPGEAGTPGRPMTSDG